MVEFTAMPLWQDAQKMRASLIGDGWCSPDTYDNCFAPLISGAAVYLFLLYRRYDYGSAFVAYVGMSTKLGQRMASHDVLSKLHTPENWPMRWFKPTATQKLRETERKYIAHFDPPWNIIGRRRGVRLT